MSSRSTSSVSVSATTTSTSAGSASSSGSGSNSASTTLSIPQTAAAGGVTLTQPPQLSTSFFKIASGQLITFGWNFTSVLATPTSLTVSAVCENGNTYPVGPTDGIIPGTATTVVWDPYSYDQAHPSLPLVQASYTLHIWDDRGPNVGASPGYMSPNTALKFALYTPQAYTPISSGWTCPSCNGAISSYTSHPAFFAILATFFVMMISGFGLLRHLPGTR